MLGSVTRRRYIADDLLEVIVEPNEEYTYKAGQYCDIGIEGKGSRLLSFASAPHEKQLRFVMHPSTSDFKQHLIQAPLPFKVTISEPTGIFTLPRPKRPKTIVGICDLIGITPFLSIIGSLEAEETPHTFSVIQHAPVAFPGMVYENYIHQSKELVIEAEGVDRWYVSGKPPFVAKTREVLLGCGVDPFAVVEEGFVGY